MASSAIEPAAQAEQAVEFEALEQRVLRAVELIKHERDARARAEAQTEVQLTELRGQAAELRSQVADLRGQLAARGSASAELSEELAALKQERDHVRKRVEKLLRQMDDLG